MGAISIFCRQPDSAGRAIARRGHHVVYRTEETNRCPGCGHAQWLVGRQTAECALCGTAIALANAKWLGAGRFTEPAPSIAPAGEKSSGANRRRHERKAVRDRKLQLLIDQSPHEFAIHNLSAGGLMGDSPAGLQPGDCVHVRCEGGILVPATVRWSADGLIGLEFESPLLLDTNSLGGTI